MSDDTSNFKSNTGMAELALFAVTLSLEKQMKGIREARTVLGATFGAIVNGQRILKDIKFCAEEMGLSIPKGEDSIKTLQRLVDAADARGIDTTRIKKTMKDVVEINRQVEGSRAGPYKTIQIARRHFNG